jgi:hypothetical protein
MSGAVSAIVGARRRLAVRQGSGGTASAVGGRWATSGVREEAGIGEGRQSGG